MSHDQFHNSKNSVFSPSRVTRFVTQSFISPHHAHQSQLSPCTSFLVYNSRHHVIPCVQQLSPCHSLCATVATVSFLVCNSCHRVIPCVQQLSPCHSLWTTYCHHVISLCATVVTNHNNCVQQSSPCHSLCTTVVTMSNKNVCKMSSPCHSVCATVVIMSFLVCMQSSR